jgi:hypothetical protein
MASTVLKVEGGGKAADDLLLDSRARRSFRTFDGQGSHGDVRQPAGHNGFEGAKIGGDVEGEAMPGDPVAYTNTDGGDFAPPDPDAGLSPLPLAI